MTRDEKLIYEGYQDIFKKAALPVAAAAIGLAGSQIPDASHEQIVKDKVAHASSVFQSSVILNNFMSSEEAAKVFVNYTHDIPIEDYKELKETLLQFTKTIPNLSNRQKAEKLQDDIDFELKQLQIKQWADKDEDAEKVTTEPYLNLANNEEILTQYKQSWQGAGGGYGKGYMQQD